MAKSLMADPYYRAGAFGLPFCIILGFVRHEPIFLLGAAFFAALLLSSLYSHWKANKARQQLAEQVGDRASVIDGDASQRKLWSAEW